MFAVVALSMGTAMAQPSDSATSDCTFAQPGEGFGSEGPWAMVRDSLKSAEWGGRHAYVFRPRDAAGAVPVVFFCPNYSAASPLEYDRLIRHMVSRGNAVIYPAIRPMAFTRRRLESQEHAFEGFDEAIRYFGSYLDTTRIAFVGHGFGAGLAPALAYAMVSEGARGANGVFLFLMSPWYPYGMDTRRLRTFPGTPKVVVQVYEDDFINDPRIARHLFDAFGVGPADKDFMVIRSDRRGQCRLRADSDVPLSSGAFMGSDDALDYHGVWRTFDGLAAYVFEGDTSARRAALSGGDSGQAFMGMWPDGSPVTTAVVTDTPAHHVPRAGVYINSWKSIRNPLYDAKRLRKVWKVYITGARRKVGDLLATLAGHIRRTRGFDDPEVMPNPIAHGYGSDSTLDATTDSFPNPRTSDLNVYLFRPESLSTPVPVLFLIPGYSGSDPHLFDPLIDHVVSRGMAVMFSPYPIFPPPSSAKDIAEKRAIAWGGFSDGVARWGQYLDTTHVGFMGQSFGGGLAPSVAHEGLTARGWGTKGAFIYLTAPWYCVEISPEQLTSFPPHTCMLIEVFDDDMVNDHEIAVDIFKSIGIPDTNKDYVVMFTDSLDGYAMRADHFVPYGVRNIYGQENLLDYYGVFRYLDALADYAFAGSPTARRVALGKGSAEQCYMGEWTSRKPVRPAEVLREPVARHPELQYLWAWNNPINPRRGPVLRVQKALEERRGERAERPVQ